VNTFAAVSNPILNCTAAGAVCSFSGALAVKIHRNTAHLFLVLYDQYCPLLSPHCDPHSSNCFLIGSMPIKTGRSVPSFQPRTLFHKRVCLDKTCSTSGPQVGLHNIYSFISYLTGNILRHPYKDEIIALRSQNRVKQLCPVRGKNVQLLSVNECGVYSYQHASMLQPLETVSILSRESPTLRIRGEAFTLH
jgi:hypothetical protein